MVPHAAFILEAPGAWAQWPSFLLEVEWESGQGKEGHWLIMNDTELQRQVQNSYLCSSFQRQKRGQVSSLRGEPNRF